MAKETNQIVESLYQQVKNMRDDLLMSSRNIDYEIDCLEQGQLPFSEEHDCDPEENGH